MLCFLPIVRATYIINKNSLGYCFGYQGVGAQATSQYMMRMTFPELAPIFGIVASLMFSIAYSSSNIFMSALSTNWNKRIMLAMAIVGFSCTTLVAGTTNSLLVFASMRFLYGVFASAINAPIYQVIARNFPPEMRSTANSVENLGYKIGMGVSSLSVYVIGKWGWRAQYSLMGGFGVLVGLIAMLFVKNPTAEPKVEAVTSIQEVADKLKEEEEKDEKKSDDNTP